MARESEARREEEYGPRPHAEPVPDAGRPEPERVERRVEPGRPDVIYVHSRGTLPASVGLQMGAARISWGAIFAGTIIALVTQLLLSLLGLSVGLGAVDPAAGPDASSIGIGAGIWWSVSALISLFLGGWAAGRLSGVSYPKAGVLHGIVTWGLVTILSVFLMTTALSGIVAGGTGLVSRGMSFMSRGGAERVLPPDTARQLREQAREGARQAREGAEGLAARAPQAGQQAASAGWKASLAAFIALLLGAVAAAIGGSIGSPPPVTSPGAPPREYIRR